MIAGLAARRLAAIGGVAVAGAWLAPALLGTAVTLAVPPPAKYKCAVGARQLIVAGRSLEEAKAAARSALPARAPGASRISCAVMRMRPAQAASMQAPAPQAEDAVEPRQSHRWRGHPVPAQELLPGETPEECIARLHIPADDKLEALCRPAAARRAPR